MDISNVNKRGKTVLAPFILNKAYMIKTKIPFVEPGELGEKEGFKQEVIFLNPIGLEPDTVLDPPDTRVWVDTRSKEVNLIFQM